LEGFNVQFDNHMNDFHRFNNSRGDNRGGFNRRDGSQGSFGDGRDSGRRTMFQATCAECGSRCEIPFEPKSNRPVYCSKCFESKGNGNSNPRRFERNTSTNNNPGNNSELKEKLDQINHKLDKLITLLSPKTEISVVHEQINLPPKLLEMEPVKTAKKSVTKKKKKDSPEVI
jgi:CxxC-x17-CxxC domain-containing protein